MIRSLPVSTVIAALALSACGDSDGDDQAISEEAATTTTTTDSNLEAWCLAWASPPPDVDEPISNEGLQSVFVAGQVRHEAMLDVAPAEIAETNQSVVDFGRELNAYLAANGWDPNAPRLEGSSAFEAAQRELGQFGEDNC